MVFTDIAGSSQLLDTRGTQAYRTALEEHRTLVRRAFAHTKATRWTPQGTGSSTRSARRRRRFPRCAAGTNAERRAKRRAGGIRLSVEDGLQTS